MHQREAGHEIMKPHHAPPNESHWANWHAKRRWRSSQRWAKSQAGCWAEERPCQMNSSRLNNVTLCDIGIVGVALLKFPQTFFGLRNEPVNGHHHVRLNRNHHKINRENKDRVVFYGNNALHQTSLVLHRYLYAHVAMIRLGGLRRQWGQRRIRLPPNELVDSFSSNCINLWRFSNQVYGITIASSNRIHLWQFSNQVYGITIAKTARLYLIRYDWRLGDGGFLWQSEVSGTVSMLYWEFSRNVV